MASNCIHKKLTSALVRTGFFALCFLLAMGWSGLYLAGAGNFQASTTWLAGWVAGVLGFWLSAPLARACEPLPVSGWVALGLLLVAGLGIGSRQGELILGGWDPGVYLHTAAAVAEKGSVKIVDPDLAVLTAEEKDLVARDLFGVVEPFGGMRVLPTGETSPSFHHAYPAMMASLWPLGGVRAALWLNPILFIGSSLCLFVLVSVWWGYRFGFLAAFLLLINPVQVWQAGFPTAEMATQFFVLACAALLIVGQQFRAGGCFAIIVSAACLGFALLIRYDTLLFMVPVAGVLIAGIRSVARPGRVVLFLAMLIPSWLHFYYIQKYIAPYYHPVSGMVIQGLVVGGIGLVVWLVVQSLFRKYWGGMAVSLDATFRIILFGGLVVWLVLAGVVRPMLTDDTLVRSVLIRLLHGHEAVFNFLAGPDAGNMFHLIAFMGWPGFFFTMFGLSGLVWRTREVSDRALLYAGCLSMVVITTHVFNDHFLMWVSRRFVPVILPLLVVGCVAFLVYLEQRLVSLRSRAWGVVFIVFVVAVFQVRETAAMIKHREWPGLITWFEKVDAAIPDGVTVFCDQPGFGAPLRYLYGHRSYELHNEDSDARTRLAGAILARLARGEQVYLFSMRGPLTEEGLLSDPIHSFPLTSFIMEHQNRWIPRTTKLRGGDFVLYRLSQHGFD